MNRISLTDWDCYLLQRALLLKHHRYVQKTPVTYDETVAMRKECRKLKHLYGMTHGLHHSLTVSEGTCQDLIRDVHALQTFDERQQWVAGTVYSPHLYKVLLTKLYA